MNKAIFLDRDGIINELVYNKDQGTIDSPCNSKEITFIFGIYSLLFHLQKLGYLLVIISNQPNIGLQKTSEKNLEEITNVILTKLSKKGITINKVYYCKHHPFAKIVQYRKKCNCRKPGSYLFKKAAKELKIDFTQSWNIGDGVGDILAGKTVGLKNILVANTNSTENLRIIEQKLKGIKPDFIVKSLTEIIDIINK